jgi:hypothetical protein
MKRIKEFLYNMFHKLTQLCCEHQKNTLHHEGVDVVVCFKCGKSFGEVKDD